MPLTHLLPRFLVLPGLLLAGCLASDDPLSGQGSGRSFPAIPVPAGAQEARVVRHTDGDTLVLRGRGVGPLQGETTKVRLLLVDAPEVTGTPECFGREAAAHVAELLPRGSTVRVAADRQPLDRFGRTLVHVWLTDGRHLGQDLLAFGYATVLVVRPNVAYLDELRQAEEAGRFLGEGVWSCPGN